LNHWYGLNDRVDQHCKTITDVVSGDVRYPFGSGLGQPDLKDKPGPAHGLRSLDPRDVGVGKLDFGVEIHGIELAVYRSRNELRSRRTRGQAQLDGHGNPPPISGGFGFLIGAVAGPGRNRTGTDDEQSLHVAQLA
jgi:hypothetical protein